MSEHGASTHRVINGGGVPQNNAVLNQVYANVLGRPVLVPKHKVTGFGSAIFAFMAAGTFRTLEEAQQAVCPAHTGFMPDQEEQRIYHQLYQLYRGVYFDFGRHAGSFGDLLPRLIRIARSRRVARQSWTPAPEFLERSTGAPEN